MNKKNKKNVVLFDKLSFYIMSCFTILAGIIALGFIFLEGVDIRYTDPDTNLAVEGYKMYTCIFGYKKEVAFNVYLLATYILILVTLFLSICTFVFYKFSEKKNKVQKKEPFKYLRVLYLIIFGFYLVCIAGLALSRQMFLWVNKTDLIVAAKNYIYLGSSAFIGIVALVFGAFAALKNWSIINNELKK